MKIATLVLLALMLMTPTMSLFPAAPQRDVPAEIESAKRALEQARSDLNHAGSNWGGHRASALNHIEQALKEVNEAEQFAREHHEMK